MLYPWIRNSDSESALIISERSRKMVESLNSVLKMNESLQRQVPLSKLIFMLKGGSSAIV